MTKLTDGSQVETDAAVEPTPAASEQPVATPSDVTREELEGFKDEVLDELRSFQSGKDKMTKSFNETQQKVLDTLTAAGDPLTESQQKVLNNRSQEDGHISQIVENAVAKALEKERGNVQPQATPELDGIFTAEGLDPRGTEAIALTREHEGDAAQIALALVRKKSSPATAASVVTTPGASQAAAPNLATLQAEFADIEKQPIHKRDTARMTEIGKEIERLST